MSALYETIKKYIEAGLSIMPAIKQTKAPDPMVGKWSRLKDRLPNQEELHKWFGNGKPPTAVAIIAGKVSQNLEILDFDYKGEQYKTFCETVLEERPELFHSLVFQRTQNGGYHIFFRNKGPVAGNQKLSERRIYVDGPGEYEYMGKKHQARQYGDKWGYTICLIETRGEGGYALCAPTDGYELRKGCLTEIPTLEAEEREYLLRTAKSLTELHHQQGHGQHTAAGNNGNGKDTSDGLAPWTDYNQKTNHLDLLVAAGWRLSGLNGHTSQGGATVGLMRPGKNKGTSGTVIDNQKFHCFTSGAAPFEPDKTYSAFEVYALLECAGDFKEAGKRLKTQGFGDQQQQRKGKIPLYEPAPGESGGEDTAAKVTALIEEFNEVHAVIMVGGKCCVLNETTNPTFGGRPDFTLSSVADFKNKYANRRIMMQTEKGEWKAVNAGKIWFESVHRRQYDDIIFSPPGPDQITDPKYYNLYRGLTITPRPGKWDILRDHIHANICGGEDEYYRYLISWLAHLFQKPGEKPGTAIVLRGKRGTGKGTLLDIIGPCLGTHYVHITGQSHLAGKFNNHLKDALLAFADECFWAGDKQSESILQGMITNDTVMVEPKGKDPFMVRSYLRLIVASNEGWVVPAGLEERRFLVLDVGDKWMQNTKLFARLREEMNNGGREAFIHHLINEVDISDIDIRTAPKTLALFEQILESMKPIEKWWYERLSNGTQLGGEASTSNWDEWVFTEQLYADYIAFCDRIGTRHRDTPTAMGMTLRKLNQIADKKRIPTGNGKRGWALVFKDLQECRRCFSDAAMMRLQWDDEDY